MPTIDEVSPDSIDTIDRGPNLSVTTSTTPTDPTVIDLTGYPTQQNLEDYITSLGILPPARLASTLALMQCGLKAKAAADKWEAHTGWKPYLAGYTVNGSQPATIHAYDPPGPNRGPWNCGGERRLNLRRGLLQLTSLKVAVVGANPGLTLTPDTHFWLMDRRDNYDAVADGEAWEVVEFAVPQWGMRKSIVLTGTWGRRAVLPADVWTAVLCYGAYLCYQELVLNISRGLFSRKDLNTQVVYATGRASTLELEVKTWYNTFFAHAQRERRSTM